VKFEIETFVNTESWDVEFDSTRVLFEREGLRRVGEIARGLAVSRALVVSCRGVRDAGHADRALRALGDASVEAWLFDGVEENPTTRHVDRGVEVAKQHDIDCIVGLGGGSAMDCAKGINFILTQGGRMEDYWGTGKATRPMLTSIGIPTTAGTGSEAQSYALISQEGTRVKMACGDRKAKFKAVILDPTLTATMPRSVAAVTGMDAISHAVESYVSTRRNPISQPLAREAWRLLESHFISALDSADSEVARGRMQIGAMLAGAAIEHSMLGAAHACSNPLTARHGVIHGTAVGLMLVPTVLFNEGKPEIEELYDTLHRGTPSYDRGQSLTDRLCELREAAGLPQTLREVGVPREAFPALAAEAAGQWTAGFNPRPVSEIELRELYEAAL
jgi:alcohol dehydrogenase